MVYDSARQKIVVYGGNLSETLEWDGAFWVLATLTGPNAVSGTAMAYDSNRQRTVLFGGGNPMGVLGETWEYH